MRMTVDFLLTALVARRHETDLFNEGRNNSIPHWIYVSRIRTKQTFLVTKSESTGNSSLKEILKTIDQEEEKLSQEEGLKCKKKIRANKVEIYV